MIGILKEAFQGTKPGSPSGEEEELLLQQHSTTQPHDPSPIDELLPTTEPLATTEPPPTTGGERTPVAHPVLNLSKI